MLLRQRNQTCSFLTRYQNNDVTENKLRLTGAKYSFTCSLILSKSEFSLGTNPFMENESSDALIGVHACSARWLDYN